LTQFVRYKFNYQTNLENSLKIQVIAVSKQQQQKDERTSPMASLSEKPFCVQTGLDNNHESGLKRIKKMF